MESLKIALFGLVFMGVGMVIADALTFPLVSLGGCAEFFNTVANCTGTECCSIIHQNERCICQIPFPYFRFDLLPEKIDSLVTDCGLSCKEHCNIPFNTLRNCAGGKCCEPIKRATSCIRRKPYLEYGIRHFKQFYSCESLSCDDDPTCGVSMNTFKEYTGGGGETCCAAIKKAEPCICKTPDLRFRNDLAAPFFRCVLSCEKDSVCGIPLRALRSCPGLGDCCKPINQAQSCICNSVVQSDFLSPRCGFNCSKDSACDLELKTAKLCSGGDCYEPIRKAQPCLCQNSIVQFGEDFAFSFHHCGLSCDPDMICGLELETVMKCSGGECCEPIRKAKPCFCNNPDVLSRNDLALRFLATI